MAPPDHSRRHDPRRERRQPVEPASDVASELDDIEDPQSRASHYPRKPLKHQKPTHINFEIYGTVTINTVSGGFSLGHQERDDKQRRQSSPPATRSSTGQLLATKRRPTAQCDSQSDPVTDFEDDSSSSSEDSASQNHKSKRVTKSKATSERPQMQSGRRTKRDQRDEGYYTGSTASYSDELAKQSEKGKGRASPSKSRGDTGRHARLSTSTKPRKSKSRAAESEIERTDDRSDQDDSGESASDEEESDEGNDDNEEEDASDDDFGKLPVQISSKDFSKSVDEKAVLDTGTKPDWVSATFYDELKSAGIPVEKVRLSPEEQIKYTDFNNNKFSPTSKVELIVQSDVFTGSIKCRKLSFFVARKAAFSILIGRNTIRKQKIMTRGKPDPDGEGVFVGVHGEILEDQKAETKKKKEDRDKVKEERRKQREAKQEEAIKPKIKAKTTSNQVAAHLATTVSRSRGRGSPQRGGKDPPKYSERQSDSSLEGAW